MVLGGAMGGDGFLQKRSLEAMSPMKQCLLFEGSDANFLALDIETYSPKGFPLLMDDPVVNFSLVAPLKHKGVLAVSVLAEPCLERKILRWLRCLLDVFKDFTLLTYNGSKFDLKYVHHRGKLCGLDFSSVFADIEHFDVYNALRESIKLPCYGQKAVESFFGIKRVMHDVNGANYHRFFDEFSLYGSLKPMFYNLEDSFNCLRIAEALFKRLRYVR